MWNARVSTGQRVLISDTAYPLFSSQTGGLIRVLDAHQDVVTALAVDIADKCATLSSDISGLYAHEKKKAVGERRGEGGMQAQISKEEEVVDVRSLK